MDYGKPDISKDIHHTIEKYEFPDQQDLNLDNIEFTVVNNQQDSLMNIAGIRLWMLISIVGNGTSDVANGVKMPYTERDCVPCLNLGHSMFKMVEGRIGGATVSSQSQLYPLYCLAMKLFSETPMTQKMSFPYDGFYVTVEMSGTDNQLKANPPIPEVNYYLKKSFDGEFTAATKEGILWKWQKENAKSTGFSLLAKSATQSNVAHKFKKGFFRTFGKADTAEEPRSKWFIVPLMEAPFIVKSWVPNGINVYARLNRNWDTKYLLKGKNANKYKVHIEKMYIKVPYIHISPDKFAQIQARVLNAPFDKPLEMWFTRPVMHRQTLHIGDIRPQFNNLFKRESQVMPERIMFTFVDNDTYEGKHEKSNMYFQHANLRRWYITMPNAAIIPNNNNPEYKVIDGDYEVPYAQMIDALQLDRDLGGTVISPELFVTTCTWYGYRLTAMDMDDEVTQTTGIGNWSLNLEFNTAPTAAQNLSILVFAWFKSNIRVHNNLTCTADYVS